MKARVHFAAKGQALAARGVSRLGAGRACWHLPAWAFRVAMDAYDAHAWAMRVRLMEQAMRPRATSDARRSLLGVVWTAHVPASPRDGGAA